MDIIEFIKVNRSESTVINCYCELDGTGHWTAGRVKSVSSFGKYLAGIVNFRLEVKL